MILVYPMICFGFLRLSSVSSVVNQLFQFSRF